MTGQGLVVHVGQRLADAVVANEASMMQNSVPTAAPVIVTWPAAVTVQPWLPEPSANVIAPELFDEAAYVATLKAGSLNVFAGKVDRSKVKLGTALLTVNAPST